MNIDLSVEVQALQVKLVEAETNVVLIRGQILAMQNLITRINAENARVEAEKAQPPAAVQVPDCLPKEI